MTKTIYEILKETNPSYKSLYYSPCFGSCKVKLIDDENLKKICIYNNRINNKELYLDKMGRLDKEGNRLCT